MKKPNISILLSILLYFLVFSGFAQVRGLVKAQPSGHPIPYASIVLQNENQGTTAGPDGRFTWHIAPDEKKIIIITAPGFDKTTAALSQKEIVVALNPKTPVEAREVHPPPQGKSEIQVGNFHRWDIRENFYGNTGVPYVLARFYPYDSLYSQTPFLKEVTLLTWSKVPEAKFRIRLFRATANGLPGEDLSTTSILARAEKGQHFTSVDLTPYRLAFPETGLFIGMEWLVLEENREVLENKTSSGKKKVTGSSYEPRIGVSEEPGYERWMLVRDTWRRSGGSTQTKKINTKLQFKLVLTD